METVETVILTQKTSRVVKERLVDVLAGAAFTFQGPSKEGFQTTWKRVRPPNKPEEGIPFDMGDPMFNPTQLRARTSPEPQVTYGDPMMNVHTGLSPYVYRPNLVDEEPEYVSQL